MNLDFLGTAASAIGGGGSGLSGIGNLIGSAVPLPFASQIGGAVGSVLGSLGIGGQKAKDANPFIQTISDNSGYTTDQVTAVCSYQEQTSKDHFDDICEFAARTPGRFEQLLGKYNDAHPTAKIVKNLNSYYAQQYQPGVQLGTVVPEAAPQLASLRAALAGQGIKSTAISEAAPAGTQNLASASATVQESAPQTTSAGLTGQDLKNIGLGALTGAKNGAIDAVMKTDIGKDAQNAGAKQWANDNGLAIGGAIAVLGSLITYLIATRK